MKLKTFVRKACFLASLLIATVSSEDADLPPLLDADDIAYFFERRDLDGLYWALSTVFSRSERVKEDDSAPLPEQLVSRGGGSQYTTAYKIRHDLEQAEYLAEALASVDPEQAQFFQNVVAPAYRDLLERIPPLDQLTRTQGLYPFSKADRESVLPSIYNKALHHTDIDSLKDESGKLIPLLHPSLDVEHIQRQWLGEEADDDATTPSHPGIIVVDNILSPRALESIQTIMHESTVWYQTKLPLKFGGYVGSYIDDGLYDRVLLDLALELYDSFPKIFEGHPLRYLWAYKYDSNYTGINLHADSAAVNVNLWLTPDEANLDPDSGGLVVFTAKPPSTWSFADYNTETEVVRERLLAPTNFANVTIPYRLNRAVIFDSALFHQTDHFSFREGYKNRRINLTLLYGTMKFDSRGNDEL